MKPIVSETNMETPKTVTELENSIEANKKSIRAAQAEIHNLTKTTRDYEGEKIARKLERAEKYKTTNGLTIHSLRQAGNEVKVIHLRYVRFPKVPVLVPVPSYLRSIVEFEARGGVTHVIIKTPLDEVIGVSSICHEDDSFDYKMGVKLALDQIDQSQANTLLVGGSIGVVEQELTV